MTIIIIILSIFAYGISCAVSYLIIDGICNITYFHPFKNLSTRAQNILLRVYVCLGPISFVLSLIAFILTLLLELFKDFYKWLVDIDNPDIL